MNRRKGALSVVGTIGVGLALSIVGSGVWALDEPGEPRGEDTRARVVAAAPPSDGERSAGAGKAAS